MTLLLTLREEVPQERTEKGSDGITRRWSVSKPRLIVHLPPSDTPRQESAIVGLDPMLGPGPVGWYGCDFVRRSVQEWKTTMKRILGFAVLAVFLLVAGWAILRSPKPRPRCLATVHVVVITNDPSGIRPASILVSNAGDHAVYLMPVFGLETRSGQWRTNLIPANAIPTRYQEPPDRIFPSEEATPHTLTT